MNKIGDTIRWASLSWNPLAMRCTRVSPGCDHCWHLRMADRHAANPTLPPRRRVAASGGPVWLDEWELDAPARRKNPAIIAVQLMGDLFHAAVPDSYQLMVWNRFIEADWHTYLVLTKRPENMLRFLRGRPPSPNVWLGVSAEDQETADERIPLLLQCPAAVRFVSLEPLLGPIDLSRHPRLSWVIAGAETGPGSRPADVAWFRSLLSQCWAFGVPFWLKQIDAQRTHKLDGVEHHGQPGAMP